MCQSHSSGPVGEPFGQPAALPGTLELLGLFIDQAATVPMMNVLAFRPEFTPPWPMYSHLTPITLNHLERLHVEAIITRLAGGKSLPNEVVQHIVAKTDGVPLYVEELTKMLLESDLLDDQGDQYGMRGTLSSATIPETLQDSLMARLDQLGVAKETAQLGAVLGREFSYEMIEAISLQDEATLQVGLGHLVQAELLYHRGRVPRSTYIFKHALIQDAAYGSLLKSRCQRVHQQIAELLEVRFPELVENQPELLAHHWAAAGEDEAALRYWQRAGQRALRRSANAEAIGHLTQGLSVLTTLPTTPERLNQELDLRVALGPALFATKGYPVPEVERTYARARELCQQIGDTPQLFPVLRGLILHYMVRGQLQEAYRLGEELLSLAQSKPEPAHLMLAHFMLGIVLFFREELARSHAHHTQAITIYDPQVHQVLVLHYGLDIGVVSRTYLALAQWMLGYPDQAWHYIQEARALAQKVSHPYSLCLVLHWAAVLHQFRREARAAHEQAEAAIALAKEQAFVHWVASGTALQGWAQAMQGQDEEGIAELRQGVAADLATGDKLFQAYFLGLLAEAYGQGGHLEAGLKALSAAMNVMNATEARFYTAELYRLKGSLLLKQPVPEVSQAEACFHQAISIAQKQGAKSWELRATTSLARLWQSQNKRQDAYDLLAPVFEWFTEGFDTTDLKDATALLTELRA